MPAPQDAALLEMHGVTAVGRTPTGDVELLDEVSLSIRKGQVHGLVGESGSGKSLTCRAIMRVLPPNVSITRGSIRFAGTDLRELDERAMRRVRGREISMILQNPMTSLNPVVRIGDQVVEPIALHRGQGRAQARALALQALEAVRLRRPAEVFASFPHQLSGGMRQRVSGAIALSCRPRLLIADEPTTALDATVQAEYLDLLREVQRETGVALLLVTHDLAVVASLCHEVSVMYAGRIVESGTVEEIFDAPRHPYTQSLLRVLRAPVSRHGRVEAIPGTPPAVGASRAGCAFAERCTHVQSTCRQRLPPETRLSPTHRTTCWLTAG